MIQNEDDILLGRENVLLIRYGEIGLKGENRGVFESLLLRHIEHVLDRFHPSQKKTWQVRKTYGRLFVEGLEHPLEGLVALSKVPGIVAINPAIKVANNIDEILAQGVYLAREAFLENKEKGLENLSFKVRTRRQLKSFPMESPEIESLMGDRILQAISGLSVDLHNPSLVLNVEVRDDGTYLYWKEVRGPGGLPVGSAGKGLLLISGGIDSPVAGYMAIKRGIALHALHFWSYPHTSFRAKDKVIDLCRVIKEYNPWLHLYIAHFTEIQTKIMELCPQRYRVLIMRRMMMRVASALARKIGALAIITGEDLGQVASQTLESLTVIEDAADILILRPLITFDKEETVRWARSLGTYEISCLPYEDCCTVFTPRHPATKPSLEDVRKAEKDLPIQELIHKCLDSIEVALE